MKIGESETSLELEVLRHVIQQPVEVPVVPGLVRLPSELHILLRHRPPQYPAFRGASSRQGALEIATPIRPEHPALASREKTFVIGGIKK